jgi:hypothetical protein
MTLKKTLQGNDMIAKRRAIRAELEKGTSPDDVAKAIVEEGNKRLLSGDVQAVDELMFDAVHDGVAPSKLFQAIKNEAVRKFKEK